MPPVATLKNVTVTFGTDRVLDRVNLILDQGERLCLTGRNGSGKSTLMKILAGVEDATSGRLLLEGQMIEPSSPREAEDLGIGIIYQRDFDEWKDFFKSLTRQK